MDAVQSRNYGQFCFLIHGPPGTGKTKTICEIVTQLGKDSQISGSILVCAPSNPAADTLAMRLRAHFGPKDLLRLNDFSRTFAEVPQELLPFCYVENDIFNLPPFATLMAYKIVVTTCRDASILIQARVTNRDLIALQLNLANAIAPSLSADNTTGKPTPLHWAALIVDEAAQATEPETLIPVLVVSPHSKYPTTFGPIFVMTGDEHQLNPRTYAISTNLQISLFQRLSSVSVYASHPLARNQSARKTYKLPMLRPAFVNLIKNYRSHPAILAVPSSLFYNNTLIPEAIHVESLQSWTGWRGRCWPVLFACNSGIDECQDILTLGGGWYNVQEAKKAIGYARDLFTTGLITEQSEICIMSPFRAQVNVLRKMARESRMWGLNIGPVDAFQGLESRFVIICTTRARKRFLDDDKSRRIGIIHERKKFNVAITRAKEGLIVIGNPWILETDECWMAFMKFCWRNSLWQVEDEAETHEDGNVNAWEPTTGSDNGEDSDTAQIAGLEAALVYKERDQWTGSQGAKRFMGEIQSQDDALWRSGLEAEAAIEEAGPA